MARYAEATTVTVESSRGEITGILAKHGVVRMGWFSEPEADTLQFELEARAYRFRIERPSIADVQAAWDEEHPYAAPGARANIDWSTKTAAEWRRRWRANVLLLKAKLEFADGEASTVVRELLPYALLPDGRTLEEAITAGSLPLLEAGKARR